MRANDIRETPRALFDQLNAEFRFTLDAAASHQNALCERYYTETGRYLRVGYHAEHGHRWAAVEEGCTGLTGSWAGHRVWCNPPFSELLSWTNKAWEEYCTGCERIVMLVPANRTYAKWWHHNVAPYIKERKFTVRWRDERDLFTVDGGKPILNKAGRVGSPAFACALLIWGG